MSRRSAQTPGRKGGSRAQRSRRPPVDSYALLETGAALALVEEEEDIAQLLAGAVTSVLSVPFGAVVLLGEAHDEATVVGQLNAAPIEGDLVEETKSVAQSWLNDADALASGLRDEIDVRQDALPQVARAGLERLLPIRLGTVETSFGAVIAGSRSTEPYRPQERAAMEALAGQASLALQHVRLDRERTRLAERLRSLNELTKVAVSSLDISEVFDRVAERVKEIIDHDRLSIALRPAEEDYVEVYAVAAGRAPMFGKGTRLPMESPMGDAIRTGEPVLRRSVPEDSVHPIEFELADKEGYISMLFVPLESRGRVFGTLNLASRRAAFSEHDVEVAREIADHLAVIVEHAWLYEESKELAKLQERNRLAHEIHDTLAQSLISIILELDLAERMIRTDVNAARGELDRARGMAREALEEARRSVLALRPSALEAVPLSDAVRSEIETLARDGIAVDAHVSGEPAALADDSEKALFRIAQEAVANIRKHARATRVNVALDYGREHVVLTITDDGTGFDPSAAKPADEKGGFGLTSMRERIASLGGELRIESAPGQGTLLTARIPHSRAAAGPAEPAAQAPAPAAGEPTIRTLIADDHTVTRQGIRRIFAEEPDIEVVAEAADGNEALEKARAFRPDLVVTDLQMPGLGGMDLIKALKEERLSTKIIILTAHLAGNLVVEGMKAGADGYLVKDTPAPELVKAIRAVHKGETILQPGAASELARHVGAGAAEGSIAGTLTPRELEVLRLLAKGLRNKEIARGLGLSERTVRFHVGHIFNKLEAGSRTEAVTKALQLGIITSP